MAATEVETKTAHASELCTIIRTTPVDPSEGNYGTKKWHVSWEGLCFESCSRHFIIHVEGGATTLRRKKLFQQVCEGTKVKEKKSLFFSPSFSVLFR